MNGTTKISAPSQKAPRGVVQQRISGIARERLRDYLADPANGFNARIAANAAAYNVPAFEVDFNKVPGLNFIMANVGWPDLFDTGRVKARPCMLNLYSTDLSNKAGNWQKWAVFSGVEQVSLDAYFAWNTGSFEALPDMESSTDLIKDTLIYLVNSADYQIWNPLNDPIKVAYNGDIMISPGQISLGPDSTWQRSIQMRATFGVSAP